LELVVRQHNNIEMSKPIHIHVMSIIYAKIARDITPYISDHASNKAWNFVHKPMNDQLWGLRIIILYSKYLEKFSQES